MSMKKEGSGSRAGKVGMKSHDERMAEMTFASVYPHYIAKVERKGRTKAELQQVIQWLTGFTKTDLQQQIDNKATFEQFFKQARIHPNAHLITGVICGYRIEDIENPLTQKVRYLDKIVDELANGREMQKILRGTKDLPAKVKGDANEPALNVKKKNTLLRSVPVDVLASKQSAASRRAAETALGKLINKYTPSHLRLIGAMRKSLKKRLPTAHEVVYEYEKLGAVVISYSPSEQGYEGVLAIRATADGVKLYFNQGKDLPDPAKLLKGSSQTRWIPVEGAGTLTRPEVVSLIEKAIAHNKVQFESDGPGSVVIRSTVEKKQRQARLKNIGH